MARRQPLDDVNGIVILLFVICQRHSCTTYI
jgi:hypothetical protein